MLLVWAPETFHRRRATWGTSKTCCRLAVSAWGSSRRSWTLASAQLQACSLSPMEAFSLLDRKSTRLNSSHLVISYAVFCLKKKKELFRCDHVGLGIILLHAFDADGEAAEIAHEYLLVLNSSPRTVALSSRRTRPLLV